MLPSPDDTAAPDDVVVPPDTDAPPDTARPDTDPIVTEESVPSQDTSELAGWLFELDRIHEVELTIPRDSVVALGASPYDWAEADVVIDGEQMSDIGVRLRGKIGSFRSLAGKPKFKLSFGEFVDDQRFYGLKELSLNNAVVDCSYMKEVVGHRLYALAGMPYLRTAYAHVTVNGADYGLYVLLETPGDVWLERHFEEPDGNLYDGKYIWYGGYSYTLLDFGDGVDALYQLEEGEDVGNADIAGVSSRLLATAGTASFYADMGEVLNWDRFHRNVAVDMFVGHVDGYSMNTNNYRVYVDPSDGRANLLAWDLDYAFYYAENWGFSWNNANGNLTNACMRDATCRARQRTAMRTFLSAWEADDFTPLLDSVEALTYDAATSDPRRECAATDIQTSRDAVRAWLDFAPIYWRGWWGM